MHMRGSCLGDVQKEKDSLIHGNLIFGMLYDVLHETQAGIPTWICIYSTHLFEKRFI